MKLTPLLSIVAILALAQPSLSSGQPPQPPGPPPPCVDAGDIQFVCGQQGPEDLVGVPGGAWVVAGAFGGSGGVNLIRVSDRTSFTRIPPPSAEDARLEDIQGVPGTADATSQVQDARAVAACRAATVHTLFVVGHGAREAIEVFELDTRHRRRRSRGSAVPSPPIRSASTRFAACRTAASSPRNFLPRGTIRRRCTRCRRAKRTASCGNGTRRPAGRRFPAAKRPARMASRSRQTARRSTSRPGAASRSSACPAARRTEARRGPARLPRGQHPLGARRLAADRRSGGRGRDRRRQDRSEDAEASPSFVSVPRDPDSAAARLQSRWEALWVGSYTGDRIAILPAPK